MQARRITVASLTLLGLCVSLYRPAQAQQASGVYQPPPATDPAQTQAGQPYPPQSDPAQAYPAQPYPQQPYQAQPYPAQPYPAQPYQVQPYPAQPYQVQPYPAQPYQPYPAPYYPAQPGAQPTFTPPARTAVRYVSRPRSRVVIAGAATLGVSWGLTALLASSYSDSLYAYDPYLHPNSLTAAGSSFGYASELWPLYIPVLGPWIQMGYLRGNGSPLGAILLGFDGVVQASGLVMIIVGAVTRTRVAVYAKNNLQVSPLAFSGGSGVLVGGRF